MVRLISEQRVILIIPPYDITFRSFKGLLLNLMLKMNFNGLLFLNLLLLNFPSIPQLKSLMQKSCFTGSDWHPNIQTEQNHLAHNVAPRFIKEPYDECRHPPRLLLLDK